MRSHPAIIKRLKRAHGHLAGVIAMIEKGRPCVDLAQQLHAVESAISNAKRELYIRLLRLLLAAAPSRPNCRF
jgi:DNA-binding FrmR family transcriptional regulator